MLAWSVQIGPPLGHVGPESRTSGGFWCLRRQAGIWLPLVLAWAVSHRLRATASLLHLPSQLAPPLCGRQLTQAFHATGGYSTTAGGGSGVLVRPGSPVLPTLAPAYRGPYRVLVPSDKYFVLEVRGRPRPFSTSNLMPHLGQSLPTPASAPRKGRPRRSPPDLSLAPVSRLGGGSVEAEPSGSEPCKSTSSQRGKSANPRRQKSVKRY